MELPADEMRRILDTAHAAVTAAIALFGNEENMKGKHGGFLCVADPETGEPALLARVGDPAEEKCKKYFDLSAEKAKRLAESVTALSSYETRDPMAGKLGGAIRTRTRILSFSGFPELGDEAVVLTIAIKLGYLSYRNDSVVIRQITHASGNGYFDQLAARLCFSEIHEALNER